MHSINVEIKTAEGELIETVGLLLGTNADPAVVRAAVEELAASLAESTGAEPAIQEAVQEAGSGVAIGGGIGSMAMQFGGYLVVMAGGGVIQGAAWDGVKKLAKRFKTGPVPADLTQLIELGAQRAAVKGIADAYGFDENDLEPVSSNLEASRCTLVYRGSDGSIFIVNVDGETGLMTRTQRIWPKV